MEDNGPCPLLDANAASPSAATPTPRKPTATTSNTGGSSPMSNACCTPGVSARSFGHCAASCRMNEDFVDLLRAFVDHNVRFMVVGAYALAIHGRPRAT